jgi:hypothetical protein
MNQLYIIYGFIFLLAATVWGLAKLDARRNEKQK